VPKPGLAAAGITQQLLLSVAEELKLPLTQIARIAEQGSANPTDFAKIETTADGAIRLLDSYILGVNLATDRQQFPLENVSVSSVLYDTSTQLDDYAKNYGVDLEMNIAGRFGPVTAHRAGLLAALVCLGQALISALPAHDNEQTKLQLATHRCRYGIVAGLYADEPSISLDLLRRGRALMGQTRQPLIEFSSSASAGIFVADSILQAMQLELKPTRHHNLYGLGAVLKPNNQLQLV